MNRPHTWLVPGLTRLVLLAAIAVLAAPAAAQSQGGGKPQPPDINRPICFWAYQSRGNRSELRLTDAGGSSNITANSGVERFTWPRWSPDGSMIGGYHKAVDRDVALMVMNRDATGEQVVMTENQFNAWNLSRPGVLDSEYFYGSLRSFNCWLGNNAFVFTGKTTYDASFFGGPPGETITSTRLFIVDATGTISPLTESAALGTTFHDDNPHWCAALNKIVFVASTPYSPGSANVWELFAINPDGSDLQRITTFGSWWDPQHAIWSPAGDRLAVCANFYKELLILDVDLSQPNPGTGEGGRVTAVKSFKKSSDAQRRNPSWSPDGRLIVYSHSQTVSSPSYPVAAGYILISDVETGAELIVYGPASSSAGPDWDPTDIFP